MLFLSLMIFCKISLDDLFYFVLLGWSDAIIQFLFKGLALWWRDWKSWRPFCCCCCCLLIGERLSWGLSYVFLDLSMPWLFFTVPPNLPLKGDTSFLYIPLSAFFGVRLLIPFWFCLFPLDNSRFLWLPLELSMERLGLAGGLINESTSTRSSSKSYLSSS